MHSSAKRKWRLIKAIGIGMTSGMLGLAIFLVPSYISTIGMQKTAAIREANLTPAWGEAFSSFAMAELSLTVLLDGKPCEGMAVSPDSVNWYTPHEGQLSLSLPPAAYAQMSASYENRVITIEHPIVLGQENHFTLDVGSAPTAPEFVICDVPEGESRTVPLDIVHADELAIDSAPNGISVVRHGTRFAIEVDGSVAECGFWPFLLTAENEAGTARTYFAVRIVRENEIIPIHTVEEFQNIRQNLSGSYLLMNDLDMSGVDNWLPIGSLDYPFSGIFDGDGHEITGFHAPKTIDNNGTFSLLGIVQNAEVRNLVIREPDIQPTVTVQNLSMGSAVLISSLEHSLIENCASIGGVVAPSDGSTGGLMLGSKGGMILHCFNSTNVFCALPNRYLPNTGGVLGGCDSAYVSYCANEGDVKGNHLTGGITGFAHLTTVNHSVNSGYIWGSTLLGEYPSGGLVQTTSSGMVYKSYFVRGQSATGGKQAVLNSVSPIAWPELRIPFSLTYLGTFQGDHPLWAYASLDAKGPIPYKIFTKQTEPPILLQSGNSISLSAIDGVKYFYTVDETSPYIGCNDGVESVDITLSQEQVFTVFAARQGYRDSEVIRYSQEGWE